MLRLFALSLGLILSTSTFAGQMQPLWRNGETACPAASATDHYIDVPLFHDLKNNAQVDRIPGLNLFEAEQTTHWGKSLRIYYDTFSPWDPAKKLLILIPGGPGQTHADLHKLVDLWGEETDLLTKFNVIAMDHRGVGCSRPLFPGNEPEESMLMRQAASDIDMIRKELVGENGQINVWGYSYGSLLAQTYALLYPKNLERLYIGGTVSNIDDWHMAGVQYESLVFSAVPSETRAKFLELTKDEPKLYERFLDSVFNYLYQYSGRVEAIPKQLGEVVKLLEAGDKASVYELTKPQVDVLPWMMRSISCIELFPYTAKFPGEYMFWAKGFAVCNEFEGKQEYFNYTPLLKQITVPTLITGGAFDHVTPAQAMVEVAENIPGSYLYIDRFLGHGFGGKVNCHLKMVAAFFSGASRQDLDLIAYSPECQDPPNRE